MPSKSSPKATSALAGAKSSMRDEVERLIQKERFKDAVKQAKLCFKEESTPENHRLLERAYFLRARQLVQLGMPASAVEVAQHLLDFGVTANDWVDEFVRLLMSLGLSKQAFQIQERLGTPELKDRLVGMAADQAVIHPERAARCRCRRSLAMPDLVRQSLERLQAKDEAGALSLLRDLARSSPLSEWKFFVRGLAAYYRRDADGRSRPTGTASTPSARRSRSRSGCVAWPRQEESEPGQREPRGHGNAGLWRAGARPAAAGVQPGGQSRMGQGGSPARPVAPKPAPHRSQAAPSGSPAF